MIDARFPEKFAEEPNFSAKSVSIVLSLPYQTSKVGPTVDGFDWPDARYDRFTCRITRRRISVRLMRADKIEISLFGPEIS